MAVRGLPLLRRRRGSYGVESTNNIRAFPGRVPHEQIKKRGTYWDFPKTISERFPASAMLFLAAAPPSQLAQSRRAH
jgi:hypothetical protein